VARPAMINPISKLETMDTSSPKIAWY